ncbi:hypothetical protein D018_5202 [Vibrio parahaemolyticus VP2007-007]|nr:hypothetical protein D018_5202 [Vibrio parahaemolyticus VP2007-007]
MTLSEEKFYLITHPKYWMSIRVFLTLCVNLGLMIVKLEEEE